MVNFNPIDKDHIVRWQFDLENTKERPLHKIKANLPHWAEFEILRNVALHLEGTLYNFLYVNSLSGYSKQQFKSNFHSDWIKSVGKTDTSLKKAHTKIDPILSWKEAHLLWPKQWKRAHTRCRYAFGGQSTCAKAHRVCQT